MNEKQCPMKNKKQAPRPLCILLSPNLMKQDIYVDIELCNICLMRKYKKKNKPSTIRFADTQPLNKKKKKSKKRLPKRFSR